jgi:hypothetical protein
LVADRRRTFSAFFGVSGWVFVNLVFGPLKEVFELRRETEECLIVYGDLSADAPPDERRMAADAFRRIGAGLLSRHVAAYRWVKRYFEFRRWDIHSAGEMLISVGRGTQFEGFSHANASPLVPLIRKSLRLPPPEPSPLTRALMANAAEPAPITPGQP